MCYSEFEDIIPEIDAMDADVITFEASRSKLTILDSLRRIILKRRWVPASTDTIPPAFRV